MNEYELIAQTENGASVNYHADTMQKVINKFDADYNRKGFKITICISGDLVKVIKKTYK